MMFSHYLEWTLPIVQDQSSSELCLLKMLLTCHLSCEFNSEFNGEVDNITVKP